MSTVSSGAPKLPPTKRGRMSALPVHAYLAVKIAESGKTNTEIAEALGYPRPNVVAMLKTGSMRLPLNKVAAMAKVLDLDPVFLLEKVLTETSPELWDALRAVIGERMVTANELRLVEFTRKHLNGFDADVTQYKEFADPMAEGLRYISKHKGSETQATLDALDRDKHRKSA